MTPKECRAKAANARHAMEVRIGDAARVIATFGMQDSLAQNYMRQVVDAREAARAWDSLAIAHPKTRAKLLREKSLPASMFGF